MYVYVLQEMDFNDSARQMAGRMSDFVPVPPIGATDSVITTTIPRPNCDAFSVYFRFLDSFSIYLFGLISQVGVVVLFFWVGWTLLGYELQKSMDMGAKNTQSCLLSVCCGCPEPVLANDRLCFVDDKKTLN
jgi:hypothetical protein